MSDFGKRRKQLSWLVASKGRLEVAGLANLKS